ncbi:MAG: IS630 family transposase [Deferribacterales bacterium]|nr:IS630 family transposase [Deferribacterales bacterium]
MAKAKLSFSQQELTRSRAKTLLKVHKTPNQISKAVGLTRQSVYNIRKRRTIKRKKGSGRPDILEASIKKSIVGIITNNPFLSSEDITDRLNLRCSSRTVRRYLHDLGFKMRKPESHLPLTDEEKAARVEWCQEYQTFQDWDRTVFTDEAGFWVFDNGKYGWFKSGVSHPVVSDQYSNKLNVWAAISSYGKVDIHVFAEKFTKEKYLDIIQDHLLPSGDEIFGNDWQLQQDNHRAHTANVIKDYMEEEIIPIDWPSKSCDLNPIENLWPIIKRKVRKRQPKTVEELEDFIYEEWDALDNDYISNLCNSIHNRIDACLRNNGAKIKY